MLPSRTSTRVLRPPVRVPRFDSLGGKLTIQYLKRRASAGPAGVPRLRSPALARLTATKRTVARAYGGKLTHTEVRDR